MSRTKKRLSRLQKQEIQKVEKLTFFAKGLTHGFGPKMDIFPAFFFKVVQDRKMSFTIFQSEKTLFQPMKTKSSKSRKRLHFSKGVSPQYWSKNGHFSSFPFLGNINKENVFYDILERENAFLGYKSKKFKKWNN